MSDDTQNLITRINALTREEAMEAALALGDELNTDEELQGEVRRFVEEVEQAPLQYIEETEELARILLVAAADDNELAPTVRKILDAVGEKAFIFGGLEIIALAELVVAGLQIVISKGQTRNTNTTTFKFNPDGTIAEMVVREEQQFGISPGIGHLLADIARLGSDGGGSG